MLLITLLCLCHCKELEECQEEVQKRKNESQKSSSVIAEHLKATPEFHYFALILILNEYELMMV